MPRFKAINNSSASIAERIASAGKLVQGEKGMSGPRERAASTDSAVTLLHEEGNDNEDEPQISKDKFRKSPIKAKDLAPNGGKRWKPEDRLYLWQNRFELGDDKAEKKHEDIGKHLGRTAQACRIELLHIRERIDYRDFAFAISSSFVVRKTTKKQLHAASQLSSPRRAKKQARRKASATKPVCASSPVAQRPLPQFSVSPVKQKIETWDRPQASSLERFPRFRSLLGARVPDMTTPSHLVSATSEPSSVGVQTRAQQHVGFARHLRELGLCDDGLPSVSTVSTATHSDADRDGARALMRLCCGKM